MLGTPVDLRRALRLDKPAVRVTYELEESTRPGLEDLVPHMGRDLANRWRKSVAGLMAPIGYSAQTEDARKIKIVGTERVIACESHSMGRSAAGRGRCAHHRRICRVRGLRCQVVESGDEGVGPTTGFPGRSVA